MSILTKIKDWSRSLFNEIHAIYLACRDQRTPWYARAIGFFIVAYALSPIDLIPDPIPILGHLDDLIIIPLGIMIVRSFIPAEVLEECRLRAKASAKLTTSSRYVKIVVATWIVILVVAVIAVM